MLLQSDEDAARIGTARRDLFARETFARSSSLLSPLLWSGLFHEAPRDLATIGGIFADWLRGLSPADDRDGKRSSSACCMLAMIAAGRAAAMGRAPGDRARSVGAAPSRFRRALAAAWTILVLAGLPLAALGIVAYALDFSTFPTPACRAASTRCWMG